VLFDPAVIDRGAEDFVGDVPGGGNRYVRHAAGIDLVAVNGAVTWEQGAYTRAADLWLTFWVGFGKDGRVRGVTNLEETR